MITYRETHDLDLDALGRLREDCGFATRSQDDLAQQVAGARWVVSAWDAARLVGFARAISDGVTNAYVSSVMVDAKYRRRGIGRELIRRLVEGRRTDGIVLARTQVDDPRIRYLAGSGIPFVVMGRTETTLPYAHVDGDGTAAFAQATRRLLALGHRDIAYIGAAPEFMFSELRRTGWAAAMRAASLSPAISAHTAATEHGGLKAARALLASTPRPTAFLCATDRIAIGALRAIKEAGLAVGRDVSVVGHDNLSASAFAEPALTTMELPIPEVGARLAEMLIALIGGADAREFAEVWPVLPIERASTGPAPT